MENWAGGAEAEDRHAHGPWSPEGEAQAESLALLSLNSSDHRTGSPLGAPSDLSSSRTVCAAGLAMAPPPARFLGLVLCLAPAVHLGDGAPPAPSIGAEPGPVIRRGQPVTIVCRGPAGADLFRLVEKENVPAYRDQEISSPHGSQGTEARFRIPAVNEDTAGTYHCLYLKVTNSSQWSARSDPLELQVTDEDVSTPPSGPRRSSSVLTREVEVKVMETEEGRKAFQALKEALASALALALPNPAKPFLLYVAEKQGMALGVLSQTLGPWKRPVAYLSKKLDPVASGWPACLRAIAATSVLVKEVSKLTLGQDIQVVGEHYVEQVLRAPPGRWLTNARLTQYQAQLLNPLAVRFLKTTALNPATMLPVPESGVTHCCPHVLEAVAGTRPDLRDLAYENADLTWYTDGSSFVNNGLRYAGAAVTTADEVVWKQALPKGTLAQRAELVALTQALRMAEGRTVNIYTDSRYAFATAHVHGAIYRERGLLTAGGKEINRQEILELLDALWMPKKVAIIHCRGHQRGSDPVARGNALADLAAKEAAKERKLEKQGEGYRARCTPYTGGWTPYEIMYGQPVPLVPKLTREEIEASNHNFLKSLQALQALREEVRSLRREEKEANERGGTGEGFRQHEEDIEDEGLGLIPPRKAGPTHQRCCEKQETRDGASCLRGGDPEGAPASWNYTMENCVRIGLAGAVLLILVAILAEAGHSRRRWPHRP
ncbi:uncharacterized protein LOC129082473 [Pteronotus mesoamericanus]|uniref:uncharacterized protein LOC129082473 n=1 Tax=Pteronotus mesoamericanus TaxID=1884717 RepID=UPI0023EB2C8D|nr:uncharacterized protein LOC129082473 [Pteronotus parnellii mesoamericanus]